jgi:NOL1/NOP2/fmu family ribosome biogenesis protein/anti-sigma regulatory factor (Ser/Thr protein kinase)
MLVTKKIQIPNKLSCLHHVRRGARIFLNDSVNEKWQFRLVLALDEAISNIIEHGFPLPKKSKIELEMNRTENGFTFIITDSAIPFNPIEKIHNQEDFFSKMKTEGFYFAVLKKTEPLSNSRPLNEKENSKKNSQKAPELLEFVAPNHLQTIFLNDSFYLVPKNQRALMIQIIERLGCMKLGTRLGEVIGKKWIPHYEYACSVDNNGDFKTYELNLEQSLSFLKGNPIDAQGADGWFLARYQGHALGWFKKIGNRTNNYYPKELRIKMEI